MNASELLQHIGETLGSSATVKSVFGEPVHASGKTVIPVAKVAYQDLAGGSARARTARMPTARVKGAAGAAVSGRFPPARSRSPTRTRVSYRSLTSRGWRRPSSPGS